MPNSVASPPACEAVNVTRSALLEVIDLAVSFDSCNNDGQSLRAVDGVSFSIEPARTTALVGESGCGKSITALSILRLVPVPPARIDRGKIQFAGRNLLDLSPKLMNQVRGSDIAMIFQEPMTSLNPVFTVGEQIIEAVQLHHVEGSGESGESGGSGGRGGRGGGVSKSQARDIAVQALHDVGLPTPRQRLRAYPHELSGGMRQRVMIAMALACKPRLLLADEPTTALDVTIQAQILDLLKTLQRERGMAMLLITHDLGVVARNADEVCVMYAGRVVERASVGELFANPLHPYTRALFQSRAKLGQRVPRLTTVPEVLNDASQFAPLRINGEARRPWWPANPGSSQMYRLSEIQPHHWLACDIA